MQIPLIGRKFHNHYADTDANFYIEAEQRGSQITTALYGTPGLKTFWDSGTVCEIRGLFGMPDKGLFFVVAGPSIYGIDSKGQATYHGALSTSHGPVYIRTNGVQLAVCDGANLYMYTFAGGSWATITATGFSAAGSLDYQDGYFIIHSADTQQFFLSDLYDGTTWNALQVASAEGWPDNILRVFVDHRELWLFGSETTECWYNSGGYPFPFDRISGAYIEYGIGAPHSVAKADNSPFWLTNRGLVVRANGYIPQVVSTRLVEHQIATYSRIDDAIGFEYVESGHWFYVLTFPSANQTWVYDITMNFWHRWASYPDFGRHRSNCYCWMFGKHLVGDFGTGKVYELSKDYYDDDGELIRGQWTLPPVAQERHWLFHKELELHMETGVGLSTEPQDDEADGPQMMLQLSDDTGITWGNERWESMGKVGQFDRRVHWHRMGRSRNRLYRFTITDPVKRIILGAYLDVEPGIG